jgi:predicted RNA-binding Zn-ribbon protein involved in translation (DUF1610 family)
MAVHPDYLHPGNYVAVSEHYCDQSCRNHNFNGHPMKVLSVSFPFICLESAEGSVIGMDMREWGFTKVSRHFARQLWDKVPNAPQRKRRGKKSKTTPDPDTCPRCGGRMRQRMKMNRNTRETAWVWWCPECGLDAGPVLIVS